MIGGVGKDVKDVKKNVGSLKQCRNPSFGLATKTKGVTRLRAKRKEARELR